MPDSTEGHHHRFKVPYLTCMQKKPKQDYTRLNEVRPEELQTVPSNRDCEARTKRKDIVVAREKYDGNVNECLEEVKKPKLRNGHRRHCQGDKEERSSNRNPHMRRRRPIYWSEVHSRQYARPCRSVPYL